MLFYRKTIILLILLCAGLFFSSCEYENKDDEISAAYDKIIAKTQNSSSEEEPEYPNDLYPECTYPPSFPCLDSSSGLVWTFKSPDKMTWKEAYSYCTRLNEGGYNDWRMPNIDELRTLIQNCSNTQTGGQCKVSSKNRCLYSDCATYNCFCQTDNSGKYSKFWDSDYGVWSSSISSDHADYAWIIDFTSGRIGVTDVQNDNVVRCVR